MDKSAKLTVLLCLLTQVVFAQKAVPPATAPKAFFSLPVEECYFKQYTNPVEDSILLSSARTDKRITGNDKAELAIANAYPNSQFTHIQLHQKLTLVELKEQYQFVKYSEWNDTIRVGYRVKVYELSGDKLTEIPQRETSAIGIVVQYCRAETFKAFYTSDKSMYPVIDRVKARFKSKDGVLDIELLGNYLKARPKEMAPYCDF